MKNKEMKKLLLLMSFLSVLLLFFSCSSSDSKETLETDSFIAEVLYKEELTASDLKRLLKIAEGGNVDAHAAPDTEVLEVLRCESLAHDFSREIMKRIIQSVGGGTPS